MATVDGLTLHVCADELSEKLTGGRIDRITQPERDELHITVRSKGQSFRLLICARADSCRVQITGIKKENPKEAPMFCMLLRKHLTGGRITKIEQEETDRIVRIEIESEDELSNSRRFTLVCELTGRHSNIILLSDGIIVDAVKRINSTVLQTRTVMPNTRYLPPPTEKKQNPLYATHDDIVSLLSGVGRIDRLLASAYYGVAPTIAEHIKELAGIDENSAESLTPEKRTQLADVFVRIIDDIRQGKGKRVLVKTGDKEQFLPFLPVNGYNFREFDSTEELFDEYYASRDKAESMRRRSYTLLHSVELALHRAERKLTAFDEAIAGEGDYNKLRIYGELIAANLGTISTGQREAQVVNYYEDPPVTVTIPLDESLSPNRNSQKYFKLYKKAKGAKEKAEQLREVTLEELEYLKRVEDSIKRADSSDALDEIRAELENQGVIRQRSGAKQAKKPKKQPPKRFVSEDGYEVLVGRNNVQNDELTFKTASPYDIWLHVKDRPGSHTIIINKNRGEAVPDSTLLFAAKLAAENSSAGAGVKVEVDYTLCRHVKKPSGALPGKVIYTNQKTLVVTV